MNTVAAVIFDMDGVLFDSEPLHMLAWQEVMGSMGIPITREWLMPWVGFNDVELAQYCCREGIVTIAYAQLVRRKRTSYYRIAAEQLQPFHGVPEGIEALQSRGIKLGVSTSSSREELEHTLGRMSIVKAFQVAVTGDEIANRKPSPEPYLAAAQQLGVLPEHCIVIEDSPAGVESGVAAGCTVLAVTSSHHADKLASAHHIFSTTQEALYCILDAIDCQKCHC